MAKVVRNTVVEVLEYATVIERTLGPVVVTVAMLSNAVVQVDPLAIVMTSSFVNIVIVNLQGHDRNRNRLDCCSFRK